jgi:hypothetical protein
MKKYIIRIILVAIIISISYLSGLKIGKLQNENKGISLEAEKQIQVREKIIYVKDKQKEITSEPISDASTDKFLLVWREKRVGSDQ